MVRDILREFRDFALKGNVVELAVAFIIGVAFGLVVTSLVQDILMPPIGKLAGNLDFSNLYISLDSKIDQENQNKAKTLAAEQPTTDTSIVSTATQMFDSSRRLPLDDARKLGPVIAYGKFISTLIDFIIKAFCVFLIVKGMNTVKKRFEVQKAAAPSAPPADVVLLTEIRDLLKTKA